MIGTKYNSVVDFEKAILQVGVDCGVIHKSHHNPPKQYYMRCHYHRKKNPEGIMYHCPANIYASLENDKFTVTRINSEHYHSLTPTHLIKHHFQQSRKTIPDNVKQESYRLFINGESCRDIYTLTIVIKDK